MTWLTWPPTNYGTVRRELENNKKRAAGEDPAAWRESRDSRTRRERDRSTERSALSRVSLE